ncbi:GDSL-type esterase/lipase family protein [Ruminococcus flavefaciens]|uniref:GDSL-type esterase/lipase family protein n=1 Tax=Ruminococcus flavefaciens TaxID=1265 RepID=UPI0026EE1691|nr:GDSL-type esterase/lipase family protein [Ruminococcus flavefaciens]
MNKFKQFVYTLLLLFTCFVASPYIYKQIWKSSKVVDSPKASAKETDTEAQQTEEKATDAPADSTTEPQPTSEGETAAPVEDEPTEPTTSPVDWVQSDASYFNDALFIGDSRTVGIRDYGTLKNAQYYCDKGLSSYQIDKSYVDGKTIWDFLSGKKFGKIYVMLGINEVGNDIEYTTSAYRKLIDGLREKQPDAIIYLEGNLHVATYAQTSAITNERIDILNSNIQELADNKKTFYINVNGIFDDGTGALPAEDTSDGIHVYAKHYATWCDWLCQNTVAPAAPAATEAAKADTTESATYTSEPATTARPQNESFSNQ